MLAPVSDLEGSTGSSGLSRGDFLRATLAAGAGASLAARAAWSSTGSPAATPRRGGQLRIGMVSEGTSETLNPFGAITYIDYLRCYALYDPFTRPAPNYTT